MPEPYIVPSLQRIMLNRMTGLEKFAAIVILGRRGLWEKTQPDSRFDFVNRVRKDLFQILGSEASINSMLVGEVGTVFEECAFSAILPDESSCSGVVLSDDDENNHDLRRLLWSVFLRLGYKTQTEFAKAISLDPGVVARVFNLCRPQKQRDLTDRAPTTPGITLERLNTALRNAGVVPRIDCLSLLTKGEDGKHRTTPRSSVAPLTVRELHLVKLAGHLARISERFTAHSEYQFSELFASLTQSCAESLVWLEETTGNDTPDTLASLLDAAHTVTCYALGGQPTIRKPSNSPEDARMIDAAQFGLGPYFVVVDVDDDSLRWRDQKLALSIDKQGMDRPYHRGDSTQLQSLFAETCCVRDASMLMTHDFHNLYLQFSANSSRKRKPETHKLLLELDQVPEKLFTRCSQFWKQYSQSFKTQRNDPELVESLFWRFISEITPSIQICSVADALQNWQTNIASGCVSALRKINEQLTKISEDLSARCLSGFESARSIAAFNELDSAFHVQLANSFKQADAQHNSPTPWPSQDVSLLRRLFAITTVRRSKRRHEEQDGRRAIIEEHEGIIKEIESLAVVNGTAERSSNRRSIHYPAIDLLQGFVNSLYRHLFSSPINESGNPSPPFVPSLAELVSRLPAIDTYGDIRTQWENSSLVCLLCQGTIPIEFEQAAENGSELDALFALIATTLLSNYAREKDSGQPRYGFIVLAGDTKSFTESLDLMRAARRECFQYKSWQDFKQSIQRGRSSLVDRLVNVCEKALAEHPESRLNKIATTVPGLLAKPRVLKKTKLREIFETLVQVEFATLPAYAVWAGESKAVGWHDTGENLSFTYRNRGTKIVYNLGDSHHDDRNSLVLRAMMAATKSHSLASRYQWLNQKCADWLDSPERGGPHTSSVDETARQTGYVDIDYRAGAR